MEIMQNIWNALITEDETIMKIVCFPFAFIEVYVTLNFFSTVLEIEYSQKQRNIYFIIMSIFSLLSLYVIPKNISVYLNLIILPMAVKFVFKQSTIKSIIAEIITMLSAALLEFIYLKLCYLILNIDANSCINIPIFRSTFLLLVYLTIFLLTKFIKFIKFDFDIFDQITAQHKRLVLLNLIFIIISIASQFYLFIFYKESLPAYITFISFGSLIIYSIISIYSILKTINLEITKRNLEQSELHNKTLELLYNNISAFKHDFMNIITAIGGYVYSKDMDGMTKYYDKILDECHMTSNLSTLNPQLINNPAIYNILANKYYKADELGIDIRLQIFMNLNDLKMDIYEFTRIFAILLDNAIEAAAQCDEKVIKIDLHDLKKDHHQLLTIENTYINKDVDLSKLSEKGYTTKTEDKGSHGIGLWQVNKIVKKRHNLFLHTDKTDEFFIQQLKIYY